MMAETLFIRTKVNIYLEKKKPAIPHAGMK